MALGGPASRFSPEFDTASETGPGYFILVWPGIGRPDMVKRSGAKSAVKVFINELNILIMEPELHASSVT
ncbi:hypothetical protein RRG08_020097 [Elysia crispata]|uniref:Uncharacterized protein n=1 Tax=Elysia crispata TaxID=231223 RepID=A0AAE1DS95_9GAST|nr:hypothetical protein RRG08_020097 [Elysia crispata]